MNSVSTVIQHEADAKEETLLSEALLHPLGLFSFTVTHIAKVAEVDTLTEF